MTADEDLRRAIGAALLRAFAARPDAPPALVSLISRADRAVVEQRRA